MKDTVLSRKGNYQLVAGIRIKTQGQQNLSAILSFQCGNGIPVLLWQVHSCLIFLHRYQILKLALPTS